VCQNPVNPLENPLFVPPWEKNPSADDVQGYKLIYRNAKGGYGQKKCGDSWIEENRSGKISVLRKIVDCANGKNNL